MRGARSAREGWAGVLSGRAGCGSSEGPSSCSKRYSCHSSAPSWLLCSLPCKPGQQPDGIPGRGSPQMHMWGDAWPSVSLFLTSQMPRMALVLPCVALKWIQELEEGSGPTGVGSDSDPTGLSQGEHVSLRAPAGADVGGAVVLSLRLSTLRPEPGCHLPGILCGCSLGPLLFPLPFPSLHASSPHVQGDPPSHNHRENRLLCSRRRGRNSAPM